MKDGTSRTSRKEEIRAAIEELEELMAKDKDDQGVYCHRPDGLPGLFLAKRVEMVEMIDRLQSML